MSLPILKRTTLWVRDTERSLHFYRDLLGLYEIRKARPPLRASAAPEGVAALAYGSATLVIEVPEVTALLPGLQRAGVRCLTAPTSYRKPELASRFRTRV